MRRPIVYALLAFACGILIQSTIGFKIIWLLTVLFAAVLLFLPDARFRLNQKQGCFFILLLIGSLEYSAMENKPNPFENFENGNVAVEGRIKGVQFRNDEFAKLELIAESITVYDADSDRRIRYDNLDEKMLVDLKGDYLDIDYSSVMETGVSRARMGALKGFNDLAGRKLKVSGVVKEPSAASNPKLFNYRQYLKTKGIRTILDSNTRQCAVISGEFDRLNHALYTIKAGFLSRLSVKMDSEAFGLLAGIMLGEKNYISEDVYRDFQRNGTAHILSVSGLHMAIVFMCIKKVLGSERNIILDVISLLILLSYAALSAFSPSVVRAVFMIAVFVASKLLAERYDPTSCCAMTALVLLIYNPYNLFSLGFQLSYLAVFSLSIVLPWFFCMQKQICDHISREYRGCHEPGEPQSGKLAIILLPLIALQLNMLPATAYFFNYLSLSAILVNIPVGFITSIILPIGLVMMMISVFPQIALLNTLFDILRVAAELAIDLMTHINRTASHFPLSSIDVTSPGINHLAVFYFMTFLICSETGQSLIGFIIGSKKQSGDPEGCFKFNVLPDANNTKIASCFAMVLALLFFMPADNFKRADIVFLDVGQGDCIHIRTPGGINVLIDSGGSFQKEVGDAEKGNGGFDVGKDILYPYLMKNGVGRIDVALLTHLHADHFQGLCSLSDQMEIGEVCLYRGYSLRQGELLRDLHVDPGRLRYIESGDKIIIEDGVEIEILYPEFINGMECCYEDENEMNLVMKLNYLGRSVLITGDLTGDDEARILELGRELKADILKVGHHGSKYSTTDQFLKAVDPRFAVIQVGKNNFGHPSSVVIEKLQEKGIIFMRTDHDHAILFDIDPEGTDAIMTMESGKWHRIQWTR